MKSYEDGTRLNCALKSSPGCLEQCTLSYEPISLAVFWMMSILSVMLPFFIFRLFLNFIRVKNEYRVRILLHKLIRNVIINITEFSWAGTCLKIGWPRLSHSSGDQTTRNTCGVRRSPFALWVYFVDKNVCQSVAKFSFEHCFELSTDQILF